MENTPVAKKSSTVTLGMAAIGGSLGVLLSCIYGPNVISWWFEPPVEVGYNCRPATDWAMSRLIMIQIVSLVVGAALALGIKKLFSRKD